MADSSSDSNTGGSRRPTVSCCTEAPRSKTPMNGS